MTTQTAVDMFVLAMSMSLYLLQVIYPAQPMRYDPTLLRR